MPPSPGAPAQPSVRKLHGLSTEPATVMRVWASSGGDGEGSFAAGRIGQGRSTQADSISGRGTAQEPTAAGWDIYLENKRELLVTYLFSGSYRGRTLPPDVVFEGNSLSVIRSFIKDVQENLGGDLRRLQNGERPLDSGSMAPLCRVCLRCAMRTKILGIGCFTPSWAVWSMCSIASPRRPTKPPKATSRSDANG